MIGARSRRMPQVGQHARRGRGLAGPHLRPPHRPRDERAAPTPWSCSTQKGKFVRRGARSSTASRTACTSARKGKDEYLYLTVNAANPKRCPSPAKQAVVVKTTLKGEAVWKTGPPESTATSRAPTGARSRTTRPTSPSRRRRHLRRRRLRLELHPPVRHKASYIRTFGGNGSEPGKLTEPHGIWMDTATRHRPRRRRPPQRPAAVLHAGRPAPRLRPGLPAALPLRRRKPDRRSRPARAASP